jgi:hypothetical protein
MLFLTPEYLFNMEIIEKINSIKKMKFIYFLLPFLTLIICCIICAIVIISPLVLIGYFFNELFSFIKKIYISKKHYRLDKIEIQNK